MSNLGSQGECSLTFGWRWPTSRHRSIQSRLRSGTCIEQAARRFEQLTNDLDPAVADVDDTEDLPAVAAASEVTRSDEARLSEAVEVP